MVRVAGLRPGKYWKRQLACLAAGLVLGAAAELAQGNGRLEAGNRLERADYGQGERVYRLWVDGLEGGRQELEVVLQERAYTEAEAKARCRQLLEQLPALILAENHSLEEVRSDLNLPSAAPGGDVRFSWQAQDPELVDSFGRVSNEGLEEAGRDTYLTLRMTAGSWPQEFLIRLHVLPLLQEEGAREKFVSEVSRLEEESRNGRIFSLPQEFGGQLLSYRLREEAIFLQLAFLGLLGAVLVGLQEKSGAQKAEKQRRQQLLLDYSELLSRLIIFLGAGMSIRTAWDRIAGDYQRGLEAGRRERRAVYEEMYRTSAEMRSGVSEGQAFGDFGRRCGLWQYIKLAGLLEQSRKNGSRDLRITLRGEMAEAFELRKHQARRLGEEAGTKLLLPLLMLLAVVMVMVAVPALMEFR